MLLKSTSLGCLSVPDQASTVITVKSSGGERVGLGALFIYSLWSSFWVCFYKWTSEATSQARLSILSGLFLWFGNESQTHTLNRRSIFIRAHGFLLFSGKHKIKSLVTGIFQVMVLGIWPVYNVSDLGAEENSLSLLPPLILNKNMTNSASVLPSLERPLHCYPQKSFLRPKERPQGLCQECGPFLCSPASHVPRGNDGEGKNWLLPSFVTSGLKSTGAIYVTLLRQRAVLWVLVFYGEKLYL